jgi:hypothetical protein
MASDFDHDDHVMMPAGPGPAAVAGPTVTRRVRVRVASGPARGRRRCQAASVSGSVTVDSVSLAAFKSTGSLNRSVLAGPVGPGRFRRAGPQSAGRCPASESSRLTAAGPQHRVYYHRKKE